MIPFIGDGQVYLFKVTTTIKISKMSKYLLLEYLDDKKEFAI